VLHLPVTKRAGKNKHPRPSTDPPRPAAGVGVLGLVRGVGLSILGPVLGVLRPGQLRPAEADGRPRTVGALNVEAASLPGWMRLRIVYE
jgi:hypothetical protein